MDDSALFAKLDTLFKTYPGPKTNPFDLKNNCVFVTMAFLMNMSLDTFLKEIETMQPSPGELGIPNSQIVQMLKDTKKQFAYQEVQYQGDTNAFCLQQCQQWSVYNLGICYKHANGGHCIVFQQTSDTPPKGGFKDLQSGQSDFPAPDNIYVVFTLRPL